MSGSSRIVSGGDARIRTGDEGFAGPCLTTWPRRRGGAILRARPLDVNVMPAPGIVMVFGATKARKTITIPGVKESSE